MAEVKRRKVKTAIPGPEEKVVAVNTRAEWYDPKTKGFKKGNPGGGSNNRLGARVQQYRVALLDTVTPMDVRNVIRKMISLACAGDVAAAKLVLDRCLGAVKQEITVQEAGRRLVAEEIVSADDGRLTRVTDQYLPDSDPKGV
jgi:hypothetical protein